MKDLILLDSGDILVLQCLRVDKHREGYINVDPPIIHVPYIACITINQSNKIYEDQLPKLTEDEYTLWYSHSFVEDGVRSGYEVMK